MGLTHKIVKYITDSDYRFIINVSYGMYDRISDRDYILKLYQFRIGNTPDLDNPKLFTEKLQWLKLNDRKPYYSQMADKCEAKKFVAEHIGNKYIVPTLGVWNRFAEIDFDSLPSQFVLKTTHDSGGIVICKNKADLDIAKARKIITASLKTNYYLHGREWPYKAVKPRIIADVYLENDENEGLHDYKVWCFNGRVEYIQYITGRIGNKTYEAFYNRNWEKQDFSFHNPILEAYDVPRPDSLDELIEISEKLSYGVPFLRCDFYILEDGSIKFGELTFYPMSGFERFHPESEDLRLGELLDISTVNDKS